MKNIIASLLILVVVFLVGCNTDETVIKDINESKIGLANPASVFCEENGGELVMQNSKQGSYGLCKFDNNNFCEEWSFYRGDCKKDSENVELKLSKEVCIENNGYYSNAICRIKKPRVFMPGEEIPADYQNGFLSIMLNEEDCKVNDGSLTFNGHGIEVCFIPLDIKCTQEQKEASFCTMEYNPVCGNDNKSYGNKCNACFAKDVDSYKFGECPVDDSKSDLIDEDYDFATECKNMEGNWINDTEECEYISKNACGSLGGTFKECESACRNDPDAMMCTMQCVPVCDFGDDKEDENLSDSIVCTQEQKESQMCTREYMPVCGDDGKTYGNKCTACGSNEIDSYVQGEC